MTGAEATAEQISNGVNKVLAYREIAKAQSEGKDSAGATRTLAKAKAVAEQIERARTGDVDGTILLRRMPKPKRK